VIISINEIIDYSKCPMYYFLKYRSGMTTDKIDLVEKYESDLHRVIYYSFSKLQENELIRVEDIKAMWGRLWVKDKRRADILFSDSSMHKDTYNSKRLVGLDSLLNFRKTFVLENQGYPVLVNQDYKVKVDKDLTLTGKFDAVIEITNEKGEKEIHTCLFRSDRDVPKMTQEYDLKYHADAFAIEKMVKNIDLKHMVYYIEKNKVVIKNDSSMNRDMFLHNVKTIGNLINSDVFYMSVSDNCQKCIYREICSNKSKTKALLDKGE
jgi:CRISPR/Cas system-associated exonuclease Cas4 (RecB family)